MNLSSFRGCLFLAISFLFFASSSSAIMDGTRPHVLYENEIKSLGIPKLLEQSLKVKVRQKMVNIPFYKEDGTESIAKDFRDNIVIMSFWAKWSTESRVMIKDFSAVNSYLKEKEIPGIVLLPIAIDVNTPGVIRSFYQDNRVGDLAFYMDKDRRLFERISKLFSTSVSVPMTLIVDKQGFIIANIAGYMNWYNLDVINLLVSLKSGDQLVL